VTDIVLNCVGCHDLPTGTAGLSSFDGETQDFKVPHLRNLYQKIGMFAAAGDQVRGSGFLHDGSVPTLKIFLEADLFSLTNQEELDLEQFLLAFDTGLKPIVGQQVSATPTTFGDPDVIARIDLMIAQHEAGNCELVVKGVNAGKARGLLYAGGDVFQTDVPGETMTKGAVRNLGATVGQEQTYTCVPASSGTRIAIDRDEDTLLDGVETGTGVFVDALNTGTSPANADTDGDGFDDGVEVAAGSDPNDPLSTPLPPKIPGLGALAGTLLGVLLALAAAVGLKRRSVA
jgi:hypothetical protein